jgi:hypothetical protein
MVGDAWTGSRGLAGRPQPVAAPVGIGSGWRTIMAQKSDVSR